MKTHFDLTPETLVVPGGYRETRLVTKSGLQWHLESAFIEDLARFLMARYESQPIGPRLVLSNIPRETPTRTRRFYRRLFDKEGRPTYDFIAWASETLALWIEQEVDAVLYAEGGAPHNNDPAFDVISIVRGSDDRPRLRIVQVKATKDNLQQNASEAGGKFKDLEEGDYDAELNNQLGLIAYKADVSSEIDVRALIYEPERHYRLTAVHGQDRDSIQIMTKYNIYVPGSDERRSLRLIQTDWEEFWVVLGDAVYAQLA